MREKCPWESAAKRLLRIEMARRDIKYPDLAALLAAKGYTVTVQSIRSKLSRGTFSAGFLLRALDAIGCENLSVQQQSDRRPTPVDEMDRPAAALPSV